MRSCRKNILPVLIIALAFWLAGAAPAKAFQNKKADTSGLTFTSIPTAADSLAMKKQMQATLKVTKTALANAEAATAKVAAADKGKPKTLWEIFLAGFLGGFA